MKKAKNDKEHTEIKNGKLGFFWKKKRRELTLNRTQNDILNQDQIKGHQERNKETNKKERKKQRKEKGRRRKEAKKNRKIKKKWLTLNRTQNEILKSGSDNRSPNFNATKNKTIPKRIAIDEKMILRKIH